MNKTNAMNLSSIYQIGKVARRIDLTQAAEGQVP